MLLVDSSAWILVLRRERKLPPGPIATCPPIVQEVLQGAIDVRHFAKLRATLTDLTVLDAMMPLERYEQAAELYMRCREAAFTIRKNYDCLIAACALRYDVELLHDDRDFDHIAKVAPLRATRI